MRDDWEDQNQSKEIGIWEEEAIESLFDLIWFDCLNE